MVRYVHTTAVQCARERVQASHLLHIRKLLAGGRVDQIGNITMRLVDEIHLWHMQRLKIF